MPSIPHQRLASSPGSIPDPCPFLVMQSWRWVGGGAAGAGPSIWTLATYMEVWMEFCRPSFCLLQKQALSLSNKYVNKTGAGIVVYQVRPPPAMPASNMGTGSNPGYSISGQVPCSCARESSGGWHTCRVPVTPTGEIRVRFSARAQPLAVAASWRR